VLRVVVTALVVAGLALSGYLMFRQAQVASGVVVPMDLCGELPGGGCDDALRSPLSMQLGISLSGWGLLYYGTLLCLLAMQGGLGEGFRLEAAVIGGVLTWLAAAASLALVALMALGRAPWCIFCISVHAINFTLAAAWRRGLRVRRGEMLAAARSAVRFVRSGQTGAGDLHWRLTALLVPALVAVALYQWAYIRQQAQQSAAPPFDPGKVLAEFEATPRREIPVDATDPTRGPDGAPLRLVVFSDFQCPICRRFAEFLREATARRGDQLQVIYKHWPLGRECNPSLSRDLHPHACRAARMAQAAHRRNKFWCYHDTLTALPPAEKNIETAADACGLNVAETTALADQESIREEIAADVALGRELGVNGTPTVFLNGRRVRDFRLEAMELLFDRELRRAGKSLGTSNSQKVVTSLRES
jgi:protein-disulfide isomerase/uncharacterized membrane protein